MDVPRKIIRFVLFGTTNRSSYLTDPTGNRRYWPLKTKPGLLIDLSGVAAESRQIIGQTVHEYRRLRAQHGRIADLPLFLNGEPRRLWNDRIQGVIMDDVTTDMQARIADWLETPISSSMLEGPSVPHDGEPMVLRTKTSTSQVLNRALNIDDAHKGRFALFKSVGELLATMPGWKRSDKKRRVEGVPSITYERLGASEQDLVRGWTAARDGDGEPLLYRVADRDDIDVL